MATVATPEHIAPPAAAPPAAAVSPAAAPPAPQQFAAAQPRAEAQKITVDGGTLSVIAVGIALFTMAFGAFTHLSGRIDGLDTKIERQGVSTIERFDRLDAKIETVARDLRAEIKDVRAEIKDLRGEMKDLRTEIKDVNAKIDQLTLLIINQNQGK